MEDQRALTAFWAVTLHASGAEVGVWAVEAEGPSEISAGGKQYVRWPCYGGFGNMSSSRESVQGAHLNSEAFQRREEPAPGDATLRSLLRTRRQGPPEMRGVEATS
ncbi:hypothetical protein CPB85DRAFT_1258634 [Mucidula mucida]|nr:hypothetical protein CPB85DRAFT_1258634 [Mucidula mucida]